MAVARVIGSSRRVIELVVVKLPVVELVVELVEGEGGCNLHSLGAELGERRGDCFEAAEENSQKQRVRLFKFQKLSKTEGKIFQICFHTSISCLGPNF